jgi:hypothetical protein
MRQVTVSAHISASREELFDFVGDLSKRPAFADHYLKDYRLARANPVGKGAAARFLLDAPIFEERADLAIVEYDRPRRIVERGGMGRAGKSPLVAVYEFIPEAGGTTRVDLTTYSEPRSPLDRIRGIGADRWLRRQSKKALERLRRIFEEPAGDDLARITVAAHEPGRNPRFGAHVPRAESGTGAG